MFTLKKFLLITAAAAVVGIGAALVWTHYQAGNINEAAAQSVNTEAPDITVTAHGRHRSKTFFSARQNSVCKLLGNLVRPLHAGNARDEQNLPGLQR